MNKTEHLDMEIKKINEIGNKSNPQFLFSKHSGQNKHGYFLVEIKHKLTGETAVVQYNKLLKGRNPWSNKYSIKEVEINTNKIGEKLNPPYRFISEKVERKNGNRVVNIQNIETGEIVEKEFRMILKGQNPWSNEFSDAEFCKMINEQGQKSNPNFIFIRDTGKNGSGGRLVEIENVLTKERVIRRHGTIMSGRNPWNDKCFREEQLVSVPLIVRHLRNWGYSVKTEVMLSKKSRIDIVATNNKNNKVYLIEVKRDQKNGIYWPLGKILKQKEKYSLCGKIKYGTNYSGCFLVSPKGLQPGCVSLNDLRDVLRNN